MKKIIFILTLVVIIIQNSLKAQVEFSEPIELVSDFFARTTESISINDIDGDGDLDIVATNYSGNGNSNDPDHPLLFWLKNVDGKGTFERQIINVDIMRNPLGAGFASEGVCLHVIDLDNDNDKDILAAASISENSLSWFENTDGKGDFSASYAIDTSGGHHLSLSVANLDEDNDLEILDTEHGFVYYDNLDSMKKFERKTLDDNRPYSTLVLDISNDGDMDILAGFFDKIVWYDNLDGAGTFSNQNLISSQANGFLHLADLDNDNDFDLLAASSNKIVWMENTNGQGTFSSPKTITNAVVGAYAVFAADFDNDNDMDVLSCSYIDNKIAWYENTDANGTFGQQQLLNHPYTSIYAAHAEDIDGDGDKDIVCGSLNKLFWFKNLTNPTSVESEFKGIPQSFQLRQNYPNPFNPITAIEFTLPKSEFVELKVYNILGKEVATLVSNELNQGNHTYHFDGKYLASGIYYYQLVAGEFHQVKKMILLR